jgi:hypothetical protein
LRPIWGALAAVAVILALTAGSALANPPGVTGTLNANQQTHTGAGGSWNTHFSLGQTFTPTVSGTLSAVGVYIGVSAPEAPTVRANPAIQDTIIGIWNSDGNGPTGSTPLASAYVSVLGLPPGWVYLEISSPPSVVAGTTYAILLVENGGVTLLDWAGDCTTDNYSGGHAIVLDANAGTDWQTLPSWSAAQPSPVATACQQDFAFETYIATPSQASLPPTSTAASAAGTAGGGSPAIPVMVACFATAAAFVAIRRYGLARR